MSNTVLILGSAGKFGRNAADAFAQAGWNVRRFNRDTDQLDDAVRTADVVVNGWNPPDYQTWHRDLLAMHQRVIDALVGTDKTVIVPGNVYVFGAEPPAPWSADTPHAATNPLGRLRIEMEARYKASGVRTIILRGGDFLDTAPSGNWFDKIMISKLHKGVLTYPGPTDVPHAWAYLPDMTRAAVMLAQKRATLPTFCDVGFPGYTLTAHDVAASLGRVTGQQVRAKPMSWLPLIAMKPFIPMFRGLCEMRFLWSVPHSLDAQSFDRLLPDFEPTPVDAAFRNAIAYLDAPLAQRTSPSGRVVKQA